MDNLKTQNIQLQLSPVRTSNVSILSMAAHVKACSDGYSNVCRINLVKSLKLLPAEEKTQVVEYWPQLVAAALFAGS